MFTLDAALLAAAAALAAALLTHWFAQIRAAEERKRLRVGHFAALAAEMNYASEICFGYLKADILIPSYRAPTFCFATSFPAILAEAVLRQDQVRAVLVFYTCINSFNLGLDQAQDAQARGDAKRQVDEVKRVCIKAIKVVPRGRDNPSHYDLMADVMSAQLEGFAQLPIPDPPDSALYNFAKRQQEAEAERKRAGLQMIDPV